MKIIKTHELTPTSLKTETEKLWIYNGLDCCVTAEVLDALLPQLDNQTGATYAFSRELQGPVLDMRLRGVRVDGEQKSRLISDYFERISQLETDLERIVIEGLGFYGFNWRSPKSLLELFYTRLQIPTIRKQGRPTVNREALERMESYFIARPIIAHLLALRDLAKKIGVLTTEIDRDGRMRTAYNIGGTSTGRFSSTFSEFGTGTNLQNIEEELRAIFIADEGMKMAYLDEPQGESRVVGAIEWNLFEDGRYLDACESGDLHTNVAKLCWPDLGWTGDVALDRKLAEQPYYRHYDYRFMCKKIGHGTNYFGKPYTLSRQAKIDQRAIEAFQPKYFTAFPAHSMWHSWVREQLQSLGVLTTLTGRRRYFFGRRDDDSTFREAVAYDPQGSLADILNRGMLAVWRANCCQLLMQIHDAILIQYPEEQEDTIIPQALRHLTQHIELKHNRTLTLTPDVLTGWNWGKQSEGNPDGLKAYIPGDQRQRSKKVSLLDRKLPRLHKRA
jgi:DNA polymerase I-like protein with 3'-5' exonuclease and polymerase domains